MLYRERALQILRGWAGKVEVGGNNAGVFVEMLQRSDTLPGERYAWCQSAQNAAWRLATGGKVQRLVEGRGYYISGGQHLAGGTASTIVFRDYAKSRGWIVKTPKRADHVLFLRDGTPYHVGMVETVLKVGPICVLLTLEGNTGPGPLVSDPGSGRDGLFKRRRVVKARNVTFVRVPGWSR